MWRNCGAGVTRRYRDVRFIFLHFFNKLDRACALKQYTPEFGFVIDVAYTYNIDSEVGDLENVI